MTSLTSLADAIVSRAEHRTRSLVAIAGPPGSGKSTLAEALAERLSEVAPTAIVPMDGFHLDNDVLRERGLLARKGAPQTFDVSGYSALLTRLRNVEDEVAAPIFDRSADLARAGAVVVQAAHRFVLTEGNYLLLTQTPWSELARQFDTTIWIEVDETVLEERLVRRWIEQGFDVEAARKRALANDLPNARLVKNNAGPADIVWSG